VEQAVLHPFTQAWKLDAVLYAVRTNMSGGNSHSASMALCTYCVAPTVKHVDKQKQQESDTKKIVYFF
jgi:hypothetical protein